MVAEYPLLHPLLRSFGRALWPCLRDPPSPLLPPALCHAHTVPYRHTANGAVPRGRPRTPLDVARPEPRPQHRAAPPVRRAAACPAACPWRARRRYCSSSPRGAPPSGMPRPCAAADRPSPSAPPPPPARGTPRARRRRGRARAGVRRGSGRRAAARGPRSRGPPLAPWARLRPPGHRRCPSVTLQPPSVMGSRPRASPAARASRRCVSR